MRIDVTQIHIDQGFERNARKCPVALAIQDNIPGARVMVLHPNLVSINKGETIESLWCVGLPVEANQFIRAFDSGQEVTPFSFELYCDFKNKDNV